MLDYCETTGCRRKFLLAYFGEAYPEERCGACDRCETPVKVFDGTEVASAVISCIRGTGERFGASYVADVLAGSKSARIRENGHDRLAAHGSGYTRDQWLLFIQEMVGKGFISSTGGRYPVIVSNDRSRAVLAGKIPVPLAEPRPEGVVTPKAGEEDYDEALFLRLRRLRKVVADLDRVPPFVVFHDRSLKEMATLYPGTGVALLGIYGVSEAKLKRYGRRFLEAIDKHCAEHGIGPEQRSG
jgi:ATP-dependent DNA helicase RecQ